MNRYCYYHVLQQTYVGPDGPGEPPNEPIMFWVTAIPDAAPGPAVTQGDWFIEPLGVFATAAEARACLDGAAGKRRRRIAGPRKSENILRNVWGPQLARRQELRETKRR